MAASQRGTRGDHALPRDYRPAAHVLRDLRLWSDPAAERPCAGLPVVAQIAGAAGACSAGALAVLVDVVAGGVALRAAHGTVGFSRLEPRGDYQSQTRAREPRPARIDWGAASSGFDRPWAERLGVALRDASAGALELPVTPYVGNSLGGLQGGIAVALLDLAAEAAGRARLGGPVATRDLSVHFLAIGRRGPLCTSARLLRADADALLLRVEARDAGAQDRLCTLATATVARA